MRAQEKRPAYDMSEEIEGSGSVDIAACIACEVMRERGNGSQNIYPDEFDVTS